MSGAFWFWLDFKNCYPDIPNLHAPFIIERFQFTVVQCAAYTIPANGVYE